MGGAQHPPHAGQGVLGELATPGLVLSEENAVTRSTTFARQCRVVLRYCRLQSGVSVLSDWDISKSREIGRLTAAATPDMLAEAAQQLGCRSVAMTYNDPAIFLEYAIDVADACRARGIKAIAVTAGYLTEAPRRELCTYIDAANVDLKAFTESFYRRTCAGHLQPVLDTLVYLRQATDV